MPRFTNSQKFKKKKSWMTHIRKDEYIIPLSTLNLEDIQNQAPDWIQFVTSFNLIFPTEKDLSPSSKDDIILLLNSSVMLFQGPHISAKDYFVRQTLQNLLKILHNYNDISVASHTDKRKLARTLGLLKAPSTVESLLVSPSPDITIVWRNRTSLQNPNFTYVVETPCESPRTLAATEENGYYIVPPSDSVIFLSGTKEDYRIELVVLRDVAHNQDNPFSKPLYEWLTAVVDAACTDRRNVRPTHEGSMTQAGLNLGARNARVFGWAKSFKKTLSISQMIEKDEDIIGASSFLWGLIKCTAPAEISEHIEHILDQERLPRLATRNVAEDVGYTLQLSDTTYTFPLQERGPPEVYMSRGYIARTHIDKAYCNYALSICVSRTHNNQSSSLLKNSRKPSSNTLPNAPVVGGGANFVDTSLKVVVKQAKATLMVFRPDFQHGTSLASGAFNHAITYAFSRRVAEAWRKILQEQGVEIEKEAGEGNPDNEPM